MHRFLHVIRPAATSVVGAALLVAAPVRAEDDTKIALAAGLGLTAASGKTTLGDGAGAIEAGVLGADAFNRAGTVIAALVNAVAGGKPVLLLAHDEQANLAMASAVTSRIVSVHRLLRAAQMPCRDFDPGKSASQKSRMSELVTPEGPAKLYASDIVAAVATDTAVSAIKLSAEDRLLINALLANRAAGSASSVANWVSTAPALEAGTGDRHRDPSVATHPADYRLIGEATMAGIDGALANGYRSLLDEEDELRRRGCTSAAAKAAFSTADELVKSLNTPADKTGLSPLASAMQAQFFTALSPLVLRLAIEQTGGTAITRSGVLYTLGLPNAATVSSGLVVSFRLINPKIGQTTLAGMVRCAVPPQNLKKVTKLVDGGASQTVCSYRAA